MRIGLVEEFPWNLKQGCQCSEVLNRRNLSDNSLRGVVQVQLRYGEELRPYGMEIKLENDNRNDVLFLLVPVLGHTTVNEHEYSLAENAPTWSPQVFKGHP